VALANKYWPTVPEGEDMIPKTGPKKHPPGADPKLISYYTDGSKRRNKADRVDACALAFRKLKRPTRWQRFIKWLREH